MTGRLRQELQKKQPFQAVEEEALLNVLRTADQLQIRFDRLFRQFGLTSSQYNVLRILRGEGAPLPILEIAARTLTVVPGITGLIDRLEQAGHVQRERCTQDRRVIYVRLTTPALALVNKIDGPLAGLHRELTQGLTATQFRNLSGLLETLRSALPTEE